MIIKIKNLTKKFYKRIILENFSFQFKDKGFYCILGESGSGKSTLLNILSGLDQDYEGNITYNENNISNNEDLLRSFRLNNFGYIYQSFNLFDNQTVYNNLFLILNGNKSLSKDEKEEIIDKVLIYLKIEKLKNSFVKNISGGEKQRVAIARSLLNDPSVIFADEPSGSLDKDNSYEVFKILKSLSNKKLVICVTHDQDLAKNYADFILRFEGNNIIENKNYTTSIDTKYDLLEGYKLKKSENKISLKFILNHYKNSLKQNKVKSFISSFFLSFSLLMLGFSILVSDTFKVTLKDSFKDLLGNQNLVLRKKEEENIYDYEGASYDEVNEIYSDYKSDLDYIGVNYLVDFESFFKDKNELYNVTKNPITKINGFTIRQFNEFEYFSGNNYFSWQTNQIQLADDEIILGMNYPTLKSICLNLQIERSYDALRDYLKENDLLVALYLKNEYRSYADEQVFKVKGINESNVAKVYHSNPLFNEKLFENNMRFPSKIYPNSDSSVPWMMQKLYYVKTKNTQNIFLDKFMYDSKYEYYIFDNDNTSYSPLTYKFNSFKNSKLYCYYSLNKSFSYEIIDQICDELNIQNNYYFSTSGGYLNYGNSILSGFSYPFFICKEKSKLENFIDLIIDYTDEEKSEVTIEDGIGYGSYLKMSGENVRFSTLNGELIEGELPKTINEIAISKGLKNLLNINSLNEEIYLTYLCNSKYKNEEYRTVNFKITGIDSSNSYFIYQNTNFSINLFRDIFRISCFETIVNSVVFECSENNKNRDISKINKYLEEYELLDVMEDVNESIDSSLNFLVIILTAFTFMALFFLISILIILNLIKIDEFSKENAIFSLLGFKFKEILKLFLIENYLSTIFSTLISIISMVFCSMLLNQIISNQLGVIMTFNFPILCCLAIAVAPIIILIIVLLFTFKHLKNIKILKLLH